MNIITRSLTVAALLLGAAPAYAQMTPLVRLNCTQATYPACNSNTHEFNTPGGSCGTGAHCRYGQNWSAVYMAGAGPGGADIVRFTIIGVTTMDEFYAGWGFSLAGMTVPQGATRWIRFVQRIVSPVRWFGPGGGRVGGKYGILGADGTFDIWRLFWNVRSNLLGTPPDEGDQTHAMYRIEQNVGPGRIDDQTLPNDTWLNVQLEVRTSSTTSATDGRMRYYRNNGNQNAPTGQSTGYSWQSASWSSSASRLSAVGYWQAAGVGSNVVFDMVVSGPKSFQYDDEWDPNWHLNDTPTVPAPGTPTSIRITH